MASSCAARMPSIYINHGGGPMPLRGQQPDVAQFLSSYAATLPEKPTAVLVVTAHWQAAVTTVSSGASMSLLFDYGGFPPETYQYKYPASGSPEVASRVCDLLKGAGLAHAQDVQRGWDHGVFVPMMLMFPKADVPIVQISLLASQDAAAHIAVGSALKPLRDEGVLIVGSGVSFHNFQYFFARDDRSRVSGVAHSHTFDEWLTATLTNPVATARNAQLASWDSAPSAREAHPIGAAEHLLPALVVAGAAGDGPAVKVGSDANDGGGGEGMAAMLNEFAISQYEFR